MQALRIALFSTSSLIHQRASAQPESLYAEWRYVPRYGSRLTCSFYHTMEIPGYGLVQGQWDLRDGIKEYTGGIDFKDQRVLEVGTASGFVCFYMEQQGAEVVAYDLSPRQSWDIVPMATKKLRRVAFLRRINTWKLNNGYWLAHRALRSKARVVYGTVYDIPASIGPVDVSTFCSVLLHVRDPFVALFNAARLTRKTILVTDVVGPPGPDAPRVSTRPLMQFVPDFRNATPLDQWWYLNPEIMVAFLGILGFGNSEVTYHTQRSRWGEATLFSVVAHRTNETALIGNRGRRDSNPQPTSS